MVPDGQRERPGVGNPSTAIDPILCRRHTAPGVTRREAETGSHGDHARRGQELRRRSRVVENEGEGPRGLSVAEEVRRPEVQRPRPIGPGEAEGSAVGAPELSVERIFEDGKPDGRKTAVRAGERDARGGRDEGSSIVRSGYRGRRRWSRVVEDEMEG